MSMKSVLSNVQGINIEDIPSKFRAQLIEEGACKLISIDDDGTPFSEWLKKQGFVFTQPEHLSDKEIKKRDLQRWGWLAIWW